MTFVSFEYIFFKFPTYFPFPQIFLLILNTFYCPIWMKCATWIHFGMAFVAFIFYRNPPLFPPKLFPPRFEHFLIVWFGWNLLQIYFVIAFVALTFLFSYKFLLLPLPEFSAPVPPKPFPLILNTFPLSDSGKIWWINKFSDLIYEVFIFF